MRSSEDNKNLRIWLVDLILTFMMGERTKLKDGEKSPLTLSCNAKEELLLYKKMRVLESLKKYTEISHTLDQRLLYNQFATKLRRSEVAHAKLLGDRELVKHLSWSPFPTLHTVVTDSSDKAVRVILQKAEASRVISAPCRIQTYLTPVSAGKDQGKKGEITDQQKSIGPKGKICTQRGDQKEQSGFSQLVNISRLRRPCTTNHQKCGRLSTTNEIYQESFMKIPSQPEHPASQIIESTMFLSPERLVGKESFLEPKCKSMEPKCMSSKKRNYKLILKSKNLFLGLDNTPLGLCSNFNNKKTGSSHNLLDNKVKLFVQNITTLKQEQNYVSQDYYSERLLEKLTMKGKENQEVLWNTEEEQSKWNLVGPESHHRSITIKKLNRDFRRTDSSLETLIREQYNEILTKENLTERNWLNNNPYQRITDQVHPSINVPTKPGSVGRISEEGTDKTTSGYSTPKKTGEFHEVTLTRQAT